MSSERDFWSRRRAGVQAEVAADQAAIEARALLEEQDALADKTDAEVLTELGLPEPETLKMGDDFTAFMSKVVPDRIRRRALRTLWRTNPVLANVDMLVDYGDDFTDAAMAVEDIQTAYQVGKGMLKHVEEMARQAEAELAPAEPEPEIDAPEPEEEVIVAAVEDTPHTEDSDADVDAVELAPSPRRMTFRIEETA